MIPTNGMILKARGRSFTSSTISATAVLMRPTFPLDKPWHERKINAQTKDLEKPKRRVESMRPPRASKMAGLRPKISEKRKKRNEGVEHVGKLAIFGILINA